MNATVARLTARSVLGRRRALLLLGVFSFGFVAMVAMFWLRDEAMPPVKRVVKVDTRSLMPRPASFSPVSCGDVGFNSPVTSRPSAFGSTASRSRPRPIISA